MATAMIEAKGLKRTYRARGKIDRGGARHRSHGAARRDRRLSRTERCGQDHDPQDALPPSWPQPAAAPRWRASDLRKDPVGVRRKIGYVSQAGSTSPEAVVGEEIISHARLYGIDKKTAIARGQELLAALDLSDAWTRTCGSLSAGSGGGSISSWG